MRKRTKWVQSQPYTLWGFALSISKPFGLLQQHILHTFNFSLRSILFWVSLTDLTLSFSIPVSVLTILTLWQLFCLSCCMLINSLSSLRITVSYLPNPNTVSDKCSLQLAPSHLFTALVESTRLPPCRNLWTAGTLGLPVKGYAWSLPRHVWSQGIKAGRCCPRAAPSW